MQLICHQCEKLINDDGEISNGKPFHFECENAKQKAKLKAERNEDIDALVLKFPALGWSMADKLYDCSEADVYNMPWVVIFETRDDSILEVEGFAVKADMIKLLNKHVAELIKAGDENESWYVSHIFYRGTSKFDVGRSNNTLTAKVTL